MGFWYEVNGQRVPNMLHWGGMALFLHRMLTAGSPPAIPLYLGLDARALSSEARFSELDVVHNPPQPQDTLSDLFLEGGFLEFWPPGTSTHSDIGYSRKPVTFTVENYPGGAEIRSNAITWENLLQWVPRITDAPPPYWSVEEGWGGWPEQAGYGTKRPWHGTFGYPWNRPGIQPGAAGQFDAITDAWRMAWFSVQGLFLTTAPSGSIGTLISTARLAQPLKLEPGPQSNITVRIGARISAT